MPCKSQSSDLDFFQKTPLFRYVANFILTRTKVSHTTSKHFLEAPVSTLNPSTIYMSQPESRREGEPKKKTGLKRDLESPP